MSASRSAASNRSVPVPGAGFRRHSRLRGHKADPCQERERGEEGGRSPFPDVAGKAESARCPSRCLLTCAYLSRKYLGAPYAPLGGEESGRATTRQ